MESLVNYGSEDEQELDNSDHTREEYTSVTHRSSSGTSHTGSRKKNDDTNYEQVQMDMSDEEDSSTSTEKNDEDKKHKKRLNDQGVSKFAETSYAKPKYNFKKDREKDKYKERERDYGKREINNRVHEYDRSKYSWRRSDKEDRYKKDNRERVEENLRDRDRDRSNNKQEDNYRERDNRDRDYERPRERDRDRDRERDRDRDKYRGKDRYSRNSDRDRDRYRERDRDYDRDRQSGGSREFYKRSDSPKDKKERKSRSKSLSPEDTTTSNKSSTSEHTNTSSSVNTTSVEKKNILNTERIGVTDLPVVTQKSNISLPSYYNPGVINPTKYAEQVQKRKLLWSNKKNEQDQAAKWESAKFAQDSDGKVASKFMRLMGIKDAPQKNQPGTGGETSKNPDLTKKQEELFSTMEQQYEVARQVTHTMRGVGLGFGSQSRQF